MPTLTIFPSREAIMRGLLLILVIGTSVGVLMAELGSNIPTDAELNVVRVQEGGSGGAGVFDVAAPPSGTVLQPVQRVPRDRFGVVGAFR